MVSPRIHAIEGAAAVEVPFSFITEPVGRASTAVECAKTQSLGMALEPGSTTFIGGSTTDPLRFHYGSTPVPPSFCSRWRQGRARPGLGRARPAGGHLGAVLKELAHANLKRNPSPSESDGLRFLLKIGFGAPSARGWGVHMKL